MKKISVIIVTYNSIDLIKDCIDSVFRYNDLNDNDVEVIVVDNSSSAVTAKLFIYLKELYNDKILMIKNDSNLGYGHGNNKGINCATGNIVCIMNPDVRLIQYLFKNAIQEFNSNKNLGLLGFKQIGGSNLSYYLKPEYYLGIISSYIVKVANRYNFFNQNYFYLSGAFFFLDKEKFVQIGKFDENLFMYFEEPDITNRMHKNGYLIKFSEKYSYHHLIGDRSEWSEFSFNLWLKSITYYLEKFNISKQTYFRRKVLEYKFLILFSKLSKNKARMGKFDNQLNTLKAFLNYNS